MPPQRGSKMARIPGSSVFESCAIKNMYS